MANAPSANLATGKNGILKNEQNDAADSADPPSEQCKLFIFTVKFHV